MLRASKLIGILCIFGLLLMGCSKSETNNYTSNQEDIANKTITLATTTSTQDSGLLEVLIPAFEKESGVVVKVVAVGTGQAIKLAQEGNADVLLVHARADEDAFVQDGYGSNAWDVMYNQFLLVGPSDDPAKVIEESSITAGLKKIDEAGVKFVSRGDESGTHKKELALWKAADLDPSGQEWYVAAGQGMGDTLMMADELKAYTLTDEATFLTLKKVDLKVVLEGDTSLLNPYGVIKVNSTKEPEAAASFIDFLVGEKGQKIIGDFKKEELGRSIFTPSAKKR